MQLCWRLNTEEKRPKIAELFYPKELQEVITDLRTKHDLNEETLTKLRHYVNHHIRLNFTVCLLFSLFLFNKDITYLYSVFILALWPTFFILLYMNLRKHVGKVVFLYNYGEFAKGKLQSCTAGGGLYHPRKYKMCVEFNVEEDNLLSSSESDNAPFRLKEFNRGDFILVAYNPKAPEENMPFINAYSDIFYLRHKQPDLNI